MTVRLAALEYDAVRPRELASFWGSLLGRSVAGDGVTLPASGSPGFALRFVATERPKSARNMMHFDLTSDSPAAQEHSVALALSLGGRHFDVGQRGDEGHVVLADPEDNEFCVIAPGNRFLAGTGRIGALAGEGSREVGYFWSEMLDWPLVWDQDEETAIQSPSGGTKITWGGPPPLPKHGRNRLRWVLECDSPLEQESERIKDLGAVLVEAGPGRVELADPGDHEFVLVPDHPA
ncbi:VOC family protein [Nocardioides campestrisoli]|uniref:VOC family protein n=1 Tax=Nocardioides campestrisoli TaxID=2736757 RepID=UPI0015E74827|nr:VOC family protein [Nocardioides campestrisoli]